MEGAYEAEKSYLKDFEGYYRTGDAGFIKENNKLIRLKQKKPVALKDFDSDKMHAVSNFLSIF